MYKSGFDTNKMVKNKIDKTQNSDKKSQEDNNQDKLEAICDACNVKTYLSFVPQPHLNVFCKDCLRKFKNGEIDVSKLEFKNLELIKKNTPKEKINSINPVKPNEKVKL